MRRKSGFSQTLISLPINFAMIAHFNGVILTEQLQTALKKIKQKQPMMAGRIIQTDGESWYDTDDAPDFHFCEVEGDWHSYLEQDLNQPFQLMDTPPARFALVRSVDGATLIMTCHHAFADGLSAAYVLRDLVHFMADPDQPVTPLPIVPAMLDLLPAVDFSKMDLSNTEAYSPRRYSAETVDRHKLYILTSVLSDVQTKTVVKRCREESTTVHAALCTAFLVAHEQLEDGEHSPIHVVSSPINMRDKLPQPVGEQFGPYISPGVYTRLECTRTRGFWDMAREFKASLNRDIASDALTKSLYRFQYRRYLETQSKELPQPTLPPSELSNFDLSLTNLGVFEMPQTTEPWQLDTIYGPAVNPGGREKILGVTTLKQGDQTTLSLTLTVPNWFMERAVGERLFESGINQLAAGVGS